MAATRKEASEMARPVRRVTKEFWGEIKKLNSELYYFSLLFLQLKGEGGGHLEKALARDSFPKIGS